MADVSGLISGGEYNSMFGAASSVADVAGAIFGQTAANKYANPSAYIKNDDVVVEEQNAGDGWKLLVLAGSILFLVVGGLIVGFRKA